MFGKKNDSATVTGDAEKTKKLSPREVMAQQIEAVEPGKELSFKLGQIYVKPYITVVRNSAGKKFTVFQDGKDAAGNPAGKRGKFWDCDKAKDIANWIAEREGTSYRV